MNLEDELRDTFRRKDAPAGLAGRVLARINEQPVPSRHTVPRGNTVRRWAGAAAVLAIATAAGQYYLHQRQAAEAARVQEGLSLALQITSETLARVQRKLSQPPDATSGKGFP